MRIGDAVDFEIEDVVPLGSASGEPVRLVGSVPSGRAGADRRARDAREIDAFGIQYQGNSAFSRSAFSWAA